MLSRYRLFLFCGYRAVIFAAVLRSPTGLTYNLAGPHRPDLDYFAAFAASIRQRGFVCALGVYRILSTVAAVAPNDTFVHYSSLLFFLISFNTFTLVL
jgi:hypothetical protein